MMSEYQFVQRSLINATGNAVVDGDGSGAGIPKKASQQSSSIHPC